jgi:WD40 repeat protein
LSSDGKKLVAGLNEAVTVRRVMYGFRAETEMVGKTVVFDVNSGQRIGELPALFADVQFSPSGKLLVSCDQSGPIRVWNIAASRNVYTFAKDTSCTQIIASGDGVHLMGRTHQGVSAWNVNTGERVLGR